MATFFIVKKIQWEFTPKMNLNQTPNPPKMKLGQTFNERIKLCHCSGRWLAGKDKSSKFRIHIGTHPTLYIFIF